MRHTLLGIIWRKKAADSAASLLRSPRQDVETEGCLYCWLIRSLKAQGMNELATNELAAAKEHLTTEEYEEILAFGANW